MLVFIMRRSRHHDPDDDRGVDPFVPADGGQRRGRCRQGARGLQHGRAAAGLAREERLPGSPVRALLCVGQATSWSAISASPSASRTPVGEVMWPRLGSTAILAVATLAGGGSGLPRAGRFVRHARGLQAGPHHLRHLDPDDLNSRVRQRRAAGGRSSCSGWASCRGPAA